MWEIIQSPPNVSLQGLPIIYKLHADRSETFYKVLANPVFNIYEAAYRNQDNIVTFDLRDYFETSLKTSLVLSENHIHDDGCKNFTVRFYEYYGNPPSAQNEITANHTICIGTVPAWKQKDFDLINNTFNDYLDTSRILSWYPLNTAKKVLTDQPELMYVLWPDLSVRVITVVVTFSDGTTENVKIDHMPVQELQVASFAVGYEALGIADINPTKTVKSYTVSIANHVRSFVVDHNPHYHTTYIVFRNSLGGFDTLACTGQKDEITEVERKISQRVYDAENPYRHRQDEFYNEHTEIVSVHSGWLTPAEKNWLNDLLISKEVYELRGNKLQKIQLKTKALDRSWRFYEPGGVVIEYERINFVL
jgi:hypothetical protein